MIFGFLFGIGGVLSFIYENTKLHNKYYKNNRSSKYVSMIHPFNDKSAEKLDHNFPLNPYIKTKYTSQQKFHYFLTLIMFVVVTTLAFEAYFRGYTKLHIKHEKLFWLPLEVLLSHFINSTLFYYYHILAHTKYIYKYIHSYHHAFSKPGPFDSLVGHPIDHTIAGILQILPMFMYEMHFLSFMIYSSLLSLMGIYEHSGIKINFPFYNTLNHHIHHKYPNKNYGSGFPILIWDIFYGTYKNKI